MCKKSIDLSFNNHKTQDDLEKHSERGRPLPTHGESSFKQKILDPDNLQCIHQSWLYTMAGCFMIKSPLAFAYRETPATVSDNLCPPWNKMHKNESSVAASAVKSLFTALQICMCLG